MRPEDIRALRTAYGLTRKDFSKAIGVTKQTLYHWEKGIYRPSRYDLVVLYRLWEMLHDPQKRGVAQDALSKAKELPHTPPLAENGGGIGIVINGEVNNFGLVMLLNRIFSC